MEFSGFDIALNILCPLASYEMASDKIVSWNDPRPQPTEEEIEAVMSGLRIFESQPNITVVDEFGNSASVDKSKFFEDYLSKISS